MKIFTKIREAAIAALVGVGLFGLVVGPAAALVLPPSYAPRQFPDQMTHYLRFTVNFNSCVPVGNCSFKVGALPYNAFITRVTSIVPTAFGSTTNSIALGTASGGGQIVAAITATAAVNTPTAGTVVAAENNTGNGATQTGTNGGFDVWATMSFTGTAPSTGTAVVVIEYFAPNDGSCQPVPMTATAGAC